MGRLAGVPIEPPEQTALLDACITQAGVIAGGVPGGKSHIPFKASRIMIDTNPENNFCSGWIRCRLDTHTRRTRVFRSGWLTGKVDTAE